MKLKIIVAGTIIFIAAVLFVFGVPGSVVAQSSLPDRLIEVSLEVPTAHPIVGYPFPVSATWRVNQRAKQGALLETPSYLNNAFNAMPPFSGKLDPYIIPDYTPGDLTNGLRHEAEFMCKTIGIQPITFLSSISYKFKTPAGAILGYSPQVEKTKNVTCAGPELEGNVAFKKSCGGSATFTGKIGKEYLSELENVFIKVNESERAWVANAPITPNSDGSFSYTLDLKPSTYHYWVNAKTKK